MRHRLAIALALVLAGSAACSMSADGAHDSALDGPRNPNQEVEGSAVTLEHGVVTSECFSFETPDLYYQLQPNAQSCQAVINYDRGYGTMAIRVAAVTGYGHAEDYFHRFVQEGFEDVEMVAVVVGGVDSHVITWEDANAGQQAMYHVPFPAERHALGVPITHVTIAGSSSTEFYSESLEMVVNSFEPVR